MALMELKSYDLKKELMVLSSKELLEGKLVLTKEIEEKESFVYSLPDPKNKKEYLEQDALMEEVYELTQRRSIYTWEQNRRQRAGTPEGLRPGEDPDKVLAYERMLASRQRYEIGME